MLQRNLQAFYNLLIRRQQDPSESQEVKDYDNELLQPFKYQHIVNQIDDTGMLDLIALTYNDENIILGDQTLNNFVDFNIGTNRGKTCLIAYNSPRGVYPIVRLQGFYIPHQVRFKKVSYFIYRLTDLQKVSSNRKIVIPDAKLIDPEVVKSLAQRLYDLPNVLGKRGITLDEPSARHIDVISGEIIFDPVWFHDGIPRDVDVAGQSKALINNLNQWLPAERKFVGELKYTPVRRTVLTYDLPEIPKTISKRRVLDLLNRFPKTDLPMCIIGAGLIDLLENFMNYSSAQHATIGINNPVDISRFGALFGSDKIPFFREDLIRDDDIKDVYTYQQDYNKIKYQQAGTEIRTEFIPPDSLEFRNLFEELEYIEPPRNKSSNYDYLKDYELPEIQYIRPKRVKINGIEFKSSDLIMFRNTLFYNLVERVVTLSQSSDVVIPYVSVADLYLIRDFLKGRIMFGVLYQGLSQQGYEYLSGQGTLLEMAETARYREDIDINFQLGEDFVSGISEYLSYFEDEFLLKKFFNIQTNERDDSTDNR